MNSFDVFNIKGLTHKEWDLKLYIFGFYIQLSILIVD